MVFAHDGAHADDNDVAVLQVFISAASDLYPMGQIGHAVPQILTLADDLLFLHIHQHQFVHNALDSQAICTMGAYMADTHNAHASCFHIWFPPICFCKIPKVSFAFSLLPEERLICFGI